MKNWSLSQKIWSVLAILCFAYAGSSAMSIGALLSSRDNMAEITGRLVRMDQLTSEIKDNQRRISIITMESILETDDVKLAKKAKEFDEVLQKQQSDFAELDRIGNEETKSFLAKYVAIYEEFAAFATKAKKLGVLNKNKESAELYLDVRERLVPPMRVQLDALNSATAKTLKARTEETSAATSKAIVTDIVTSVVSIIAALTIAFFVLRALTRSIASIVYELSDSSTQVSSASAQIASSSGELSQSATEQAAALEETAAAIEELNSTVAKNSENAGSTASTSNKSQEKAAHGKQVVERMILSMGAISESNETIVKQINQSNESMAGIVKVIEEIGLKTKVINDIVFQTKLLSFNASVEAARAGEHGKGFAVVAEEVGNLAQMSGNAAKEISALLDDSVQKVNLIVSETKSSVSKLVIEGKNAVESGTQVARQCGEVLEEIVQGVASVNAMAVEIASASQEQSRGVAEISKAMSQLDQMTQQNAATSEECASAAEQLSAQSETMKAAVEGLVATVNGANTGQTSGARASGSSARTKVKDLKPTANVVHMKSLKTGVRSPVRGNSHQTKTAVGAPPQYDSEGFEDV